MIVYLRWLLWRGSAHSFPRGEGAPVRTLGRMRNGDILPFAMQPNETVQPFPLYLFNELQINSEHFAVPHQS